ncbi:hypothetical protein RKD49_000025 [Streptomyces glaucescens]
MTRVKLSDPDWEFIEPYLPIGEYGPYPERLRQQFEGVIFHGCYSVGDDKLWGISRRRKGIDHTWAALRPIRAVRPDGAPIYVILDNLSAHLNWRIRRWAVKNKV